MEGRASRAYVASFSPGTPLLGADNMVSRPDRCIAFLTLLASKLQPQLLCTSAFNPYSRRICVVQAGTEYQLKFVWCCSRDRSCMLRSTTRSRASHVRSAGASQTMAWLRQHMRRDGLGCTTSLSGHKRAITYMPHLGPSEGLATVSVSLHGAQLTAMVR
jgi:hypothetical protein